MLTTAEKTEIIKASNFVLGSKTKILLLLAIAVGLISFIIALASGNAQPAWQALLVNTLFFSGLAYGSLIFSVIITITKAKWGRPIKRLAESTVLFIPISWFLFAVLFLGMDHFFEWTDPTKLIPAKGWWLNVAFFITRNIVLLILTGFVGVAYVVSSLKPDVIELQKLGSRKLSYFAQRLISNSLSEHDVEIQFKRHGVLAPIFALLYAILTCIVAFDWIMSIDQEWYSTLFGFQYSIANIYAAAAFLVIVSTLVLKKTNLSEYLSAERHNDLSRLLFASALFWTYFVFSQILVIWYANIPKETPYLILRMRSQEWSGMFYFLLILLFLVPFIGLLSRTACRSHLFSSLIAAVVLVGLWFEKYFLTIPSIQENRVETGSLPGIVFNPFDITLTLGVGGAFLLMVLFFLTKLPALPLSDPIMVKQHKGC